MSANIQREEISHDRQNNLPLQNHVKTRRVGMGDVYRTEDRDPENSITSKCSRVRHVTAI